MANDQPPLSQIAIKPLKFVGLFKYLVLTIRRDKALHQTTIRKIRFITLIRVPLKSNTNPLESEGGLRQINSISAFPNDWPD